MSSSSSLSDWVPDWQCHLFKCPGQLKSKRLKRNCWSSPSLIISRSNPSTIGNISFFVSSEFIYFYLFLLLIIIVNRFCSMSFFACWTCSSGIIAIICTTSLSLLIHLYFQSLLLHHRILSHQTLVRCGYLTVLHSARSYLNLADLKLKESFLLWKKSEIFITVHFFLLG